MYQLTAPTFTIVEWGYLTLEAFKSVVRFVGSHSGAFESFEYACGYSGNSQNYLLNNPFAKMTVLPYMMGRIVDIERFLVQYPFNGETIEFAVEVVEDEYAKWNEGIIEVQLIDGKNKIKKVAQTDLPIISGTIQHMTQLLMGYRKLEELAFYDKVNVAEESIPRLTALFPQQPPILNDYF